MLAEESQEFGKTKGFSLIKGKIKLMKLNKHNKVPHIGWEKRVIKNEKNDSNIPILRDDRFYFVHYITSIVKTSIKKLLLDK